MPDTPQITDVADDAQDVRPLDQLAAEQEVRSASFAAEDIADDGSEFEGYAAVFDEPAEYDVPGVGRVVEVVKRGAFRRALKEERVIPMLYHHLETHPPLATTASGNLELSEDAKGLRVRARVADHYIGQAVKELIRSRDIPGMSWGFVVGKDNQRVELRKDGRLERTLTGFNRILDVSPTWNPTYRGTMAELRSQTFGTAFSPEVLQQLSEGTRQQLAEQGITSDGEEEEAEERTSGADWKVQAAARERRLLIATAILKGVRL